MLTEEQLKEIKERTKAKHADDYLDGSFILHDSRHQVCCGKGIGGCCLQPECVGEHYKVAEFERKEDAEAYFNARTDIHALLEHIERQDKVIQAFAGKMVSHGLGVGIASSNPTKDLIKSCFDAIDLGYIYI